MKYGVVIVCGLVKQYKLSTTGTKPGTEAEARKQLCFIAIRVQSTCFRQKKTYVNVLMMLLNHMEKTNQDKKC